MKFKIMFLLIAVFLLFGCLQSIKLPFGLSDYAEPKLDNATITQCQEGRTLTAPLVGNETVIVNVKIVENTSNFCYVQYTYDGMEYESGYRKSLGKLCSYEAKSTNVRKSNSLIC